jgi:hypothetical protein
LTAELCTELEPEAADENSIVRHQRKTPADRRGSDPQVRVMGSLMQAMSDQAALVAKLRGRLDRLRVYRKAGVRAVSSASRRSRTGPQFAFRAPYRASARVWGVTRSR